MYEASIAKGILDTAIAALPQGKARITKITVVAGVLGGVEKESLELYFNELTKGTPAQGAQLELLRKPATLICKDCRNQVPYDNLGDMALKCAKCGGPNKLQGGNELFIQSMEIEEE